MQLVSPSNELLCLVAAYAPSIADRAYVALLTSLPSEVDFRAIVRLCGLKQEDAAIALLERYPSKENAVLVTEYVPELALFALAHIEHSTFEVLAGYIDRYDEDVY